MYMFTGSPYIQL